MQSTNSVLRTFRKIKAVAQDLLANRIQQISHPNAYELEAKRNARFGRLNVIPAFDLCAHIQRVERNGDVRAQFARAIVAGRV